MGALCEPRSTISFYHCENDSDENALDVLIFADDLGETGHCVRRYAGLRLVGPWHETSRRQCTWDNRSRARRNADIPRKARFALLFGARIEMPLATSDRLIFSFWPILSSSLTNHHSHCGRHLALVFDQVAS